MPEGLNMVNLRGPIQTAPLGEEGNGPKFSLSGEQLARAGIGDLQPGETVEAVVRLNVASFANDASSPAIADFEVAELGVIAGKRSDKDVAEKLFGEQGDGEPGPGPGPSGGGKTLTPSSSSFSNQATASKLSASSKLSPG